MAAPSNDIILEGSLVGPAPRHLAVGICFFCPTCGEIWAKIPSSLPSGWYSSRSPCSRHPTPTDDYWGPAGSLLSTSLLWRRESASSFLRSHPDLIPYEFFLHLDWIDRCLTSPPPPPSLFPRPQPQE